MKRQWKRIDTNCKQRFSLCHTVLVEDYGGHLVTNQPRLKLIEKW